METLNDKPTEQLTEQQTLQEKNDILNIFSRDLTQNNSNTSHRRNVLNEKCKQNQTVQSFIVKNPPRNPMPPPRRIHMETTNTPTIAQSPPLPPKNMVFQPNLTRLKNLPPTEITKPTGKKDIVFVLRGNIRDAFDEKSHLENFVKLLTNKYNVSIYIHTWTNKECKKTWRHEASMYSWKKTPEELLVTEETIRSYFKNFSGLIKKITLEDETTVKLNGRTEGQLTNICTMPTKSWKYFIHNLYTSLTKIDPEDRNKTIFSMRFDMIQTRLFSTWHGFNHDNMLESYFKICCSYLDRSNLKYKWCKMQSIGGSSSGYDNAILGDFKYLEKIFHLLEMKLDTVLVKCAEQCDSRNQEIFVERLRDKLIHNINYFDFIFKLP
jgi:hypothetical protein